MIENSKTMWSDSLLVGSGWMWMEKVEMRRQMKVFEDALTVRSPPK